MLKYCPIFDSSPLVQNSKFNNFLWVCWFLCKNLSNFVPPAWKLHNPYWHNVPKVHHWGHANIQNASIISYCDTIFYSFVLPYWDPFWNRIRNFMPLQFRHFSFYHSKGTSMYYVIKILGFLIPPPSPLCDYFQYWT